MSKGEITTWSRAARRREERQLSADDALDCRSGYDGDGGHWGSARSWESRSSIGDLGASWRYMGRSNRSWTRAKRATCQAGRRRVGREAKAVSAPFEQFKPFLAIFSHVPPCTLVVGGAAQQGRPNGHGRSGPKTRLGDLIYFLPPAQPVAEGLKVVHITCVTQMFRFDASGRSVRLVCQLVLPHHSSAWWACTIASLALLSRLCSLRSLQLVFFRSDARLLIRSPPARVCSQAV
jgi:hypothetical protein